MTYAILSDIHGNLEALQQVEAALNELPGGIDGCLNLGDLVGYNADPAACLARGLHLATCCIRGNHDRIVAGIASDRDLNPAAQAAARRHRQMLSAADRDRLRALRKGPVQAAPGIVLCHGSPDFEDLYLADDYDARVSFEVLRTQFPDARVCFYGHTHFPVVLQQQRPAETASSCSSARSVAGNATWTVSKSFSCTLMATSSGTSIPSSSCTAALGSDNNLLRKSASTLALSLSRALSSLAVSIFCSSCSNKNMPLAELAPATIHTQYTIQTPIVKKCQLARNA